MNPLYHPHDALFKETLSNKDNARSFLANYLPKDVLVLLNLEQIEIEKDSFVTEELQEYYSDLLYKVTIAGKPGYIYVLFEHKSNPDHKINLQLLEYMVQCWKLKRVQKQILPVILPVVVYHGQDAWNAPLRLSQSLDCFDERLRAYVPDFEYILQDLSRYEDKQIVGTPTLKVMLQLMRYIKSPELRDRLCEILRWLDQETDLAYLVTVTVYILNTTDIPLQSLVEIAEQNISQTGGTRIMSTLQRMLEQSRLEGKVEGELKGKLEGELKGKLEGELKGKLEGIEMALEIKFGAAGLSLMPQMRAINDLNKLTLVQQFLKQAKDMAEFQSRLAKL